MADFILQSDKLVKDKNEYYKEKRNVLTLENPLMKHGLYVLFIMQLLHLLYGPWYHLFMLSFLITIFHIIIDHIKLSYLHNNMKSDCIQYFIIDQFIHLIIIYLISSKFIIEYQEKSVYVLGNYRILSNKTQVKIPDLTEDQLICIIIFIAFSFIAGYIISFALEKHQMIHVKDHEQEVICEDEKSKKGTDVECEANSEIATTLDQNDDDASEKGKKLGIRIGIIERMLVMIFVASGQFAAMGLILAGKSLARFEDLKDKEFSEYYLLGTLLSFLFGITGGLLINIFK